MTEAEWLAATDPAPMLEFLRGKVSDRKLRLFAVCCCHRIGSFITDPGSKRMVEITERAADGLVDREELQAIDYYRLTDDCGGPDEPGRTAFMVAGHVGHSLFAPINGSPYPTDAYEDAVGTADGAAEAMGVSHERLDDKSARFYPSEKLLAVFRQSEADAQAAYRELHGIERLTQSKIVRCIFGNPSRPVPVAPSWFTSTVVPLAEGIYQERAFDRLPILADALEDAGCDNEAILTHCRSDGPHVRGCWVVDLLTGRT